MKEVIDISEKEIRSMLIRMPAELYERIQLSAKKTGATLNSFVLKILDGAELDKADATFKEFERRLNEFEKRLTELENKK